MTDLEEYLEQLTVHLADLPAAERAELLDDVAEHLAEVAAEDVTPLAARLGPPGRYAAELRAAAGLPAPGTVATTVLGRWKRRAVAVDRRVGPVFGYERSTDFLRHLAPAWWVLRGYAVVAAVLWALDRPSVVPTLGGNAWVGGLITAAAIVGSVWLGRRGPAHAVGVRALAGAAQLVFAGLVLATAVQAADAFDRYDDPQYPVEADLPVPAEPRYIFACQDPRTGVNQLMIGSDGSDRCPDGYAVVFVKPNGVYQVTPAPTPS
jgi:hypothetical protein